MQDLTAVLEIIASVSADLTLDEMLSQITEKTAQFLNVDGCAISLWDRRGNTVMVMADYIAPNVELDEDDVCDAGEVYSIQDFPSTATVLYDKRPIMVYVDDRGADEKESALLERYQWQGVLMLPMVYKAEAIGLMEIYTDRTDRDEFTTAKINLCQILANQAAVAVENARAFTELKDQQEELRELSLQLVNAQENEARRIARDLHDQLGQNLTALRINLDIVNQSLPSDVSARLTNGLKEARNLAAHTQEMARDLWVKLRPPILDELGLVSALYWEVDRYEQRTGLHIDFQDDLPNNTLGPELDITVYRIIIEALTNVVRHAKANNVLVDLRADDGYIVICVKDDGIGFDADQLHTRFDRKNLGLIGMQERVKLHNGKLQIISKPDAGTEITVLLPC